MAFRQEAGEPAYRETIDAALEAGITFFDTSNVYVDGESERALGRAMKGRRDRFIVASKVGAPEVDDSTSGGLGRENVQRCCEKSLQRLGTDYIDLYLCHFPDPETPIEETVGALDELVRQGKVRHVGCSNFESWRLCEALNASDRQGSARFACNQLGYNLLDRRIEDELIPYCERAGVAIAAYAPTAIGLLSGRYRLGQPPPSDSPWFLGPYNYVHALTPQADQVIGRVISAAGRHRRTPTQVAIAWCLSRPQVNCVVIGCDAPEHVRENVEGSDWRLSDDEVRELDEVSDGQHLTIRKDCPAGYEPVAGDRQGRQA
jgi:aryl-alcohol dehydrogenase-like predicted oxidoreductase